MQKENLIKNEKEKIHLNNRGGIFSQIDLDTKKEIAKIGMTASMGITVATSFYMKNRFMKNLHIGAGVALVGFSFWHHILYQPENKKEKINQPQKLNKESDTSSDIENYAISLNSFFIELSIKGKLTHAELKEFTNKIEALLNIYKVPSINILVDLRTIEGIELKALLEDIFFTIKHLESIKKVAVLGDNKFEKYSVKTANKLLKTDISYFEKYDTAHSWLIA